MLDSLAADALGVRSLLIARGHMSRQRLLQTGAARVRQPVRSGRRGTRQEITIFSAKFFLYIVQMYIAASDRIVAYGQPLFQVRLPCARRARRPSGKPVALRRYGVLCGGDGAGLARTCAAGLRHAGSDADAQRGDREKATP